jgi:hypothetical protein
VADGGKTIVWGKGAARPGVASVHQGPGGLVYQTGAHVLPYEVCRDEVAREDLLLALLRPAP